MIADLRERELALDINKSFIVQAPAGSGKTSLLTMRYLKLLVMVDEPEEILAITFTKKAASEMRHRILSALEMAQRPLDDTVSDYTKEMVHYAKSVSTRSQKFNWNILANPNRLIVKTIDSLCSQVIHNMPIMTKFGAGLVVAEDSGALYQSAVDKYLTEYQSDHLFHLISHLGNNWQKCKTLMCEMLATRDKWLPYIIGKKDQKDLLEHGLRLLVQEAEEGIEKHFLDLPCKDELISLLDFSNYIELSNTLLTSTGSLKKRMTAKEGFNAPSNAKNKEEKAVLKDRKDRITACLDILSHYPSFILALDHYRKLPEPQYTDDQWQILLALLNVLPELTACLTLTMQSKCCVDYTEIAMGANLALSQSDLTNSSLSKIKHLMVDEFQDTSVNQFILFNLITDHFGNDNTCFLVGDPMQSIYRFRQAEVSIFLQAKKYGLAKIKLEFLQLVTNFRSDANLVDWFNNVIAHAFPTKNDMTTGAITYADAASGSSNKFGQIIYEGCDTNDKIVEIIQQENQNEQTIAILVRSRTALKTLLPALQKAEIEYNGVEIQLLSEIQVVQDALALTNAILHIDDRLAWLAVSRSPYVGLDLKTIKYLASYDGSIFHAMFDEKYIEIFSASMQQRIIFLRETMNYLRFMLHTNTISVVMKKAISIFNFSLIIEKNDTKALDGYLNFLNNLSKEAIKTPRAIDDYLSGIYFSENKNSNISIMTIHKAKGLEFDVVILPELAKKTPPNKDKLLLLEQRIYNSQNYFVFAPIRDHLKQENKIFDYLLALEKQRLSYEAARLLYVAVTRAKKKIYLLADKSRGVPSNAPIYPIWRMVQDEFTLYEDLINNSKINLDISLKRLPVTSLSQNFHSNEEEGDIELKPNLSSLYTELGNIVHKILYRISTESLSTKDLNLNLINVYADRSMLVGDEKSELRKYLQTAFNVIQKDLSLHKILSNNEQSWSEWSLCYFDGNKSINIILDRVIKVDGQIWVIDYKVCQNEILEEEVERYSPQLKRYRFALSKLFPKTRIKAMLYFILQQEMVVVG